MDWSRIKTIFILTFIVLDVYLVYQFMNTRNAAEYEIIKEASLEEKLKNDDIRYDDLPQTKTKERYISVKPKEFTSEDLEKGKGKSVTISEGNTLFAELDKPFKLNGKFEPSEFTTLVKANVLFGEEYRFWEKDDEEKTITYYQVYHNKTFYYNSNAKLVFYFNEKNEVTSYRQTYLEVINELSDDEEVLNPLRAVEALYKKGLLKPKSKIKVELGYSTLFEIAAVLTPTWRIEVNGEENLFVHAFEGQVMPISSEENKVSE